MKDKIRKLQEKIEETDSVAYPEVSSIADETFEYLSETADGVRTRVERNVNELYELAATMVAVDMTVIVLTILGLGWLYVNYRLFKLGFARCSELMFYAMGYGVEADEPLPTTLKVKVVEMRDGEYFIAAVDPSSGLPFEVKFDPLNRVTFPATERPVEPVVTTSFTPESVIAGSRELPAETLDDSQLAVMSKDGTIHGFILRIGDYLVLPNHLYKVMLECKDEFYVRTKASAAPKPFNLDAFTVKTDVYETLGDKRIVADITILEPGLISKTYYSVWQLKAATTADARKGTVYVGPFMKDGSLVKTVGQDTGRPERALCTREHTATTLPGASGTLVKQESKVVGMHVGTQDGKNVYMPITAIRRMFLEPKPAQKTVLDDLRQLYAARKALKAVAEADRKKLESIYMGEAWGEQRTSSTPIENSDPDMDKIYRVRDNGKNKFYNGHGLIEEPEVNRKLERMYDAMQYCGGDYNLWMQDEKGIKDFGRQEWASMFDDAMDDFVFDYTADKATKYKPETFSAEFYSEEMLKYHPEIEEQRVRVLGMLNDNEISVRNKRAIVNDFYMTCRSLQKSVTQLTEKLNSEKKLIAEKVAAMEAAQKAVLETSKLEAQKAQLQERNKAQMKAVAATKQAAEKDGILGDIADELDYGADSDEDNTELEMRDRYIRKMSVGEADSDEDQEAVYWESQKARNRESYPIYVREKPTREQREQWLRLLKEDEAKKKKAPYKGEMFGTSADFAAWQRSLPEGEEYPTPSVLTAAPAVSNAPLNASESAGKSKGVASPEQNVVEKKKNKKKAKKLKQKLNKKKLGEQPSEAKSPIPPPDCPRSLVDLLVAQNRNARTDPHLGKDISALLQWYKEQQESTTEVPPPKAGGKSQ